MLKKSVFLRLEIKYVIIDLEMTSFWFELY